MMRGKLLPWISTPILLVGIIVLWKLVISVFGVSSLTLPQPEDVLTAIGDLFSTPGFWDNVRTTLIETLVGFGIALVLGVAMGIVLGRVIWLERATRPLVVASQVVPKVALIPLFIIWFGFGMTSKIIIVALLAFFPIMLNVQLGVRSVEAGHRELMRSLNASRWATFSRLEYHSTMPYVLAGAEIGIVFAIIGAVVGEYSGADKGLGLLINHAQGTFDSAGIYAGMIIITVIALLAEWLLTLLERRLLRWRPPSSGVEAQI
jgi:NitT/TauT family transport system permease protein